MTDTTYLGLPFIEGGQAQKHVTHNEALRILDAVIQVSVRDADRTVPPGSPEQGDRYIVAPSPTGAWSGYAFAIATWEDGAWRFIAPNSGWIAWSIGDDMLLVFDGDEWRDLRDMPAMFGHLGVNTTADTTNRLSVRSNAVLLADVATSDGGDGNVRLQLSKQNAGKTASVVFSNAFSGRAEFGLVGSDAFRLKVSPDGSSFADALVIDQATGNLALPRGLSWTGVISPAQMTSNQNDYAPSGFSAANILRISTDASRNVTGLAAGTDGRMLYVCNVGAFNLALKDESASSTAANRFGFGADLTLAAKQGAMLVYDGVSARWRQVGAVAPSGSSGTLTSVSIGNGLTGASNPVTASGDIRIDASYLRGYISGLIMSNNSSDATNDIDVAPGVATADDQSQILKLPSAITKRLDAAWAVGSGNGGLDTGSIANTTYHIWLIQRSDTGVVDALFSASVSSPAMPTNYDRKRRIGSVIRASAAIKPFVQEGDDFVWVTPGADKSNATDVNTMASLITLASIPTGVRVKARFRGGANSGANAMVFYSPLESGVTAWNTPIGNILNPAGTFVSHELITNTSAQIGAVAISGSTTYSIATTGFTDTRGRAS